MRPSRLFVVIVVSVGLLLVSEKPICSQTVVNVHNFTGDNSGFPFYVTPAQGRDGRLYGTTGGLGGTNYGTIFKLSPSGAFQQIHSYDLTDGSEPNAGVTLASDGTFYGTTGLGGNAGLGVLFRISATGAYTVLHEFAGGTEGAVPGSAPIDGLDGNLYGTTYGNATTVSTIYKYTLASGTFATIYQFNNQAEGSNVVASLLRGTDGNLYGTAYQGGSAGCGALFKLSTNGTLLWDYSFPCQPGGSSPIAPLIQATDGNFYGTTYQGGAYVYNYGTVFKLTTAGVVSILYSFQGFLNNDGAFPFGGLVQGSDGNLYGSTGGGGGRLGHGTLFQISTAGAYQQIHVFTNTGTDPLAALMQDTSGLFYGTTLEGGPLGFGVVYSLNMGLAPFVALVQYQGKVGGAAQILGQGLTGTTSVKFNGVAATSFTVVNDTYMTAVVPSGATTGRVVVATPGGTLTSNKNFRIQ
ncbi:MAG TPA: choice-of-anchor tandem repeat GloVer-containing protein [Candidatus Acidoferrum sp.]|jgi:uncharacterized repeat protein (TIGR03803 family)|nr:choice-of-anchor tandem repeat GloVer-containing protein [Candidatus Acidoferrum sp.]